MIKRSYVLLLYDLLSFNGHVERECEEDWHTDSSLIVPTALLGYKFIDNSDL